MVFNKIVYGVFFVALSPIEPCTEDHQPEQGKRRLSEKESPIERALRSRTEYAIYDAEALIPPQIRERSGHYPLEIYFTRKIQDQIPLYRVHLRDAQGRTFYSREEPLKAEQAAQFAQRLNRALTNSHTGCKIVKGYTD